MTSDSNDIWKDFSSNDKELLRTIAREVALLVAKPADKKYFQEQLILFVEKRKNYEDTLKAYREGTWKPSMGKPLNPYTAIRQSVTSGWKEIVDFISESKHGPAGRKYDRKHGITIQWIPNETRILASYVELAVIHDTVRPEPESLCKDIIPIELFDAILAPYLEKPDPLLHDKPLQPGSYDLLDSFAIKFKKIFGYVRADFAKKPSETEQGEKPDALLDSKILNLARRRIKVKFAERRKALSEEVERIMCKLGFEGCARSSGAFKLVRDACDSEIDRKANIVWGSIQDVLNAVGSPLTNTLAIALKQEVGYHIEAIVEEISKYMIQRLPMSKSDAHYFDFENIKREVIERISVKVDLYVDSLPCKPAEIEQNRKTTIVAIIISLFIIFIFVFSVRFIPFTPFTWLKNHPNSYGLQGSIFFLIPCLIVGLFKPQSRKWCWRVAAIAFVVLFLSLLGGPADSNVN